jgi:hypothetical protein
MDDDSEVSEWVSPLSKSGTWEPLEVIIVGDSTEGGVMLTQT